MTTNKLLTRVFIAMTIILSCLNLAVIDRTTGDDFWDLESLGLTTLLNNSFASGFGMHCRGCGGIFANRIMTCCYCDGRIDFLSLRCNVCYCDTGYDSEVIVIEMCC